MSNTETTIELLRQAGQLAYVTQSVFDHLVDAHGEEIAKYLVVVEVAPQTEVEQLISLYGSLGLVGQSGEG